MRQNLGHPNTYVHKIAKTIRKGVGIWILYTLPGVFLNISLLISNIESLTNISRVFIKH